MKKGISLPINAIIIIVIAVIVLIAILSMFTTIFRPSSSTVSLETATKATCLRVNPTLCRFNSDPNFPHENMAAARSPVYDFDANKDGIINTFTPDGNDWLTSYLDDNLETLCMNFHSCSNAGLTEVSWTAWSSCCLKRICGC